MEDGAVGYGENYGMEVTGSCTLLNQWSAKYSKV